MTGSAGTLRVRAERCVQKGISKGEGVRGRGGQPIRLETGLADDGKRSAALGVLLTCVYPIGGGVRRGGGSQIEARRRAGGFLQMVVKHSK